MLAVVLFATSLFFAGLSAKLRSSRATAVTLTLGGIVFVAGLVWIVTMPVHVTT